MLRAGDKVFFCDNADGRHDYVDAFRHVVGSLNLTPVVYAGAGTSTKNSSLDQEIRDDFYASKLAVLRLGPPTPSDNWALTEQSAAKQLGHPLLIYRTVAQTGDPALDSMSVFVEGAAEFSASLRSELNKLLT